MAGGDDGERGARAELARAEHLLHLGRPTEALDTARRAALADPTSALAEAVIATCHLQLDEPQPAIHHAGRAAALAPEWDHPHRVRSRALQSIGHRDEALRAAEVAVALGPDSWMNHATLAVSLAEHHRRGGEALQAAERAISLAPDEPDAFVEASFVALARRRWDRAEEWAQRALALDPDDPGALNNLGAALARGRRTAAGLEHFARSARVDPRSVGGDNARRAAVHLAHGLNPRAILLGAVAAYAAVLLVAAIVPDPARRVVLALVLVGTVVAAVAWYRERQRRIEQYDEATRRLVERARVDPGEQVVAAIWTVFGVSTLLAVLFFVDLFSPSEATPTTNVVAMLVATAVALVTGQRLRQIYRARKE